MPNYIVPITWNRTFVADLQVRASTAKKAAAKVNAWIEGDDLIGFPVINEEELTDPMDWRPTIAADPEDFYCEEE